MNTSFAINCSDWQDPDQPLTYEFSYINYEHESVFYVSREPFAPSVVLPMGHEDNDFKLTLNIQITDRLGASAIKKVLIKVGGCDRNLFGLQYNLAVNFPIYKQLKRRSLKKSGLQRNSNP